MSQKILIVDDEPDLREIYRHHLDAEKCQILESGSGLETRKIIEEAPPDLVLLDLNLPDENGISILKWVRKEYPLTETIIISGTGSIHRALESVKFGAFDYLEKPVDSNRLIVTVRNALSLAKLSKENTKLNAEISTRTNIIGNSKTIEQVLNLINIAGPSEATVLILGESGVGKELVANAIQKRSKRCKKSFVKLNCAAIPQELIESELFGHVKGSFTGAIANKEGKAETADGGTLFLDEIADMSLMTQAKVLRFIQDGHIERIGGTSPRKVDVRIIAATNKSLEDEIKNNRFRQDLFYRLNVIPIHVPPLRDRIEDVSTLAMFFLRKHGHGKGYAIRNISQTAIKQLESYSWPGNVRELENVIERSIIFCTGDTIEHIDIPSGQETVLDADFEGPFSEQIDQYSKRIIVEALDKHHWKKTDTAAFLGLHRNTLLSKMKKLEIEIE